MNGPTIFLLGLLILGLIFAYCAAEKTRNKKFLGLAAGGVLALLCGLALSTQGLKPGIDLAGGSSFTVKIDPKKDDNGQPVPVTEEDRKAAMKVIGDRLDPGQVKDLNIQAVGQEYISIEMPGISETEANEVREILEKAAVLNFRAVHPDNNSLAFAVQSGSQAKPPGYELLDEPIEDDDGNPVLDEEGEPTFRPILVEYRPRVRGSMIKDARPDPGKVGVLQITLTSEGGKRMLDYTSAITPGRDRMAHVLDGKVIGAPGFQSRNLGSQFIINGIDGGRDAVAALAQQLRNPLDNPLLVEEQRQVSPRLGKATIQQGIYAGIGGLALTLIFVLIYYRLAGVVAFLGLLVNMLIIFGLMAMFDFSFTLPGIAGIILTIGVSVDANVLIFERLREEMADGKSVAQAIKNAYEKAFSAIIDANITTLLTAIILFALASGTVKGFAITLTIGIASSVFAALILTRVIFWFLEDANAVKKLSFMNLIPEKSFDFLSKGKIAFITSIGLIVLAIGGLGIRNEKALGIDFTGGAITRFELGEQKMSVPKVKESLDSLELAKKPQVQEETIGDSNFLSVRAEKEDAQKIISHLATTFPELSADDSSTEEVSASLGDEFFKSSLFALGMGLLAILFYITLRFEFSFAIGAFVALAHDVIISIGLVVLLGGELSLIHVGAILTIAGYSINDTIVVFDRIREQIQVKTGSIKELMNEAISATLSRTILTSATTFVSVLVLFIFGGEAMRDFALAMMIGVVVGTYSSIFVASTIVNWWSEKRGTNLRTEVIDAQLEAQVNPDRA